MSKPTIPSILNRDPHTSGYVFRLDDSYFWTDYRIMTRDDPELSRYLGDFVLRRVAKGRKYPLETHRDAIRIRDGEEITEDGFYPLVKSWFNADPSEGLRLFDSDHIRIEGNLGLCVGEGNTDRDVIFVDPDYHAYAEGIAAHGMKKYLMAHRNSGTPALVHYVHDKETRAVLAPKGSAARLDFSVFGLDRLVAGLKFPKASSRSSV